MRYEGTFETTEHRCHDLSGRDDNKGFVLQFSTDIYIGIAMAVSRR